MPALISLLFVLGGILFFGVSITGMFSGSVNVATRFALFGIACVVILMPVSAIGLLSIKVTALVLGAALLTHNILSERRLHHAKWICDATTG